MEKVNLILKKQKRIEELQEEINQLRVSQLEESRLIRYFVYIIQDTSVKDPIVYQIGEESIELQYKPIYVGRGYGNRDTSHLSESHNPDVKRMVETYNVKIEKVLSNLSWIDSVNFEQELIYSIGRRDLDKGPLLNASGGIYWNQNKSPEKPGPLNLELNKVKLILDRLNQLSKKRLVAESLGISERSLYRLINDYNIAVKKDGKQVQYYQV